MINNLKVLNVFSVIEIYKRSLNGTKIFTRNCLIGNGYNQNVFLSLEKGKDVLTGGTRPKSGRDKPFTVVKGNTKFTEFKEKRLRICFN